MTNLDKHIQNVIDNHLIPHVNSTWTPSCGTSRLFEIVVILTALARRQWPDWFTSNSIKAGRILVVYDRLREKYNTVPELTKSRRAALSRLGDLLTKRRWPETLLHRRDEDGGYYPPGYARPTGLWPITIWDGEQFYDSNGRKQKFPYATVLDTTSAHVVTVVASGRIHNNCGARQDIWRVFDLDSFGALSTSTIGCVDFDSSYHANHPRGYMRVVAEEGVSIAMCDEICKRLYEYSKSFMENREADAGLGRNEWAVAEYRLPLTGKGKVVFDGLVCVRTPDLSGEGNNLKAAVKRLTDPVNTKSLAQPALTSLLAGKHISKLREVRAVDRTFGYFSCTVPDYSTDASWGGLPDKATGVAEGAYRALCDRVDLDDTSMGSSNCRYQSYEFATNVHITSLLIRHQVEPDAFPRIIPLPVVNNPQYHGHYLVGVAFAADKKAKGLSLIHVRGDDMLHDNERLLRGEEP